MFSWCLNRKRWCLAVTGLVCVPCQKHRSRLLEGEGGSCMYKRRREAKMTPSEASCLCITPRPAPIAGKLQRKNVEICQLGLVLVGRQWPNSLPPPPPNGSLMAFGLNYSPAFPWNKQTKHQWLAGKKKPVVTTVLATVNGPSWPRSGSPDLRTFGEGLNPCQRFLPLQKGTFFCPLHFGAGSEKRVELCDQVCRNWSDSGTKLVSMNCI